VASRSHAHSPLIGGSRGPEQHSGKLVEQFVLGLQVRPEVGKVALQVPILAESMAEVARSSRARLMAITDPDRRECLR
jgi:hypothetical protein